MQDPCQQPGGMLLICLDSAKAYSISLQVRTFSSVDIMQAIKCLLWCVLACCLVIAPTCQAQRRIERRDEKREKREHAKLSCGCRWRPSRLAASQTVTILLYTTCNGSIAAAAEAIASATVSAKRGSTEALATSVAIGLVGAGSNVHDLMTASATQAFTRDSAAALGSGFAIAIMSLNGECIA